MKIEFLKFFVPLLMILPMQGQSIAPSSGKALCSALTPADFIKVGVPVTRAGEPNLDNQANAYCVYESKAGKVEFDIFFPAGSTSDEINATERTVIGEAGGGKSDVVKLTGADHGRFVPVPGNGALSIVVRRGSAVFNVDVPQSANARQQLTELAQIVLTRLKP
jgi:hypothetical protein